MNSQTGFRPWNAAPTAILGRVVRLQSNYRGFMFRSRYSSRMKTIALYAKDQVSHFAVKSTS